jgi:CO/xanthine dehydrogenase FAD-binding subunit
MLLNTFDYVRPNGLGEVLKVLDHLKHEKTLVVAGGTDLIPALRNRTKQADHIVDLSGASLDGLVVETTQARIGSLVTFARLCEDAELKTKLPAVAEAASLVGAVQCRNLATIGGNLCSAVPSLDSAPPLLALEAKLRLQSYAGERLVPVDQFFVGPRRTVLEPGEILTEILVPIEEGFAVSFVRLGRRKALTLSIVNVAAGLALDKDGLVTKARIALGAVAPTPVRAPKAEQLLEGRHPTAQRLAEVAAMVTSEIAPISDLRASADYRRKMSALLVRRALEKSLSRVRGDERAMAAEGAGQ